MSATSQKNTDKTLAFWQPRSMRILGTEDARQMLENASGFFCLLIEWTRPIPVDPNHQVADKETLETKPEHSDPALHIKRVGSGR